MTHSGHRPEDVKDGAGSPRGNVQSGSSSRLTHPVRCLHCNSIYDLCGAGIGDAHIARYADCDVFKSPCCGRTVDTRRWKSLPDMEDVEQWEVQASLDGLADLYGRIVRHKVVR